jgi:tetratricopeptide (TPR) repeat protein
LRDVDLQTIPSGRHSDLARLYDGLTTETLKVKDDGQLTVILNNVGSFLSGEGWFDRVKAARRQMDAVTAEVDGALMPLADILAMSGSDQVIEALRSIDHAIERGHLASAMDEAFRVIDLAPTYLPLHLRIGEILVKEDRVEAAIAKYMAVAQVYEVRGDVGSAGSILERVIRLAPMDPSARNRIIQLFSREGRVDDALRQHVDLAETYYRQADLNRARQTFADGLRLASESEDEKGWSVQFLHAMGDIDMQRLDWRQALRVYQQIKTLVPDDEKARTMLVDLHFRLGQIASAMGEVDDWLRYHLQQGQVSEAMNVLEELVRQRPDEAGLRTRLARFYQERGRKGDAIAQLDALSELQIRAGQQHKAAETVRAILAMQPAAPDSYRQLLAELESGRP